MSLLPQSLDAIDYYDLDMFVHGDPFVAWEVQREHAPVWYHESESGEPFWSVVNFDDVKAVHSDPLLFSSEANGIMLRDTRLMEVGDITGGVNPMIHTDPPRHAPHRKSISHEFTPRAIGQLEDQIRGFAVEAMEEAADRREIDFVADIAHRVPAAIAFTLMGVPREKWERLSEIEHLSVTAHETEFWDKEESTPEEVAMESHSYFFELCSERMENPGDDLLSQLINTVIDGAPLGPIQGVADAALLLAGGLDTTRAAASAGGMVPLMNDPEQLDRLAAEPSLLPVAIEEMVRWASPVTSEARTVMADTDILGPKMSEGDRICVWSPAANRDPKYFDDPYRWDMTRSPNRHIGFAWGEHYCLGVHLARMTLRVEFEEFFKRFKGFEQTGEARRVRSNFVGGLVRMPMRLTPR